MSIEEKDQRAIDGSTIRSMPYFGGPPIAKIQRQEWQKIKKGLADPKR
jgi:hypothetical protein